MSGSGTIPMKRFALVSGLLFLLVYLWVKTFHPDESGTDLLYPVIAGSSSPETLPYHDTITRSSHDPQYVTNPPICYYLIVGSFTDFTQAQEMAEKYEDIFGTGILILPPTPEGYYRISCGRYLTGKEADAALVAVRQNHYPDAWVLAIKNQFCNNCIFIDHLTREIGSFTAFPLSDMLHITKKPASPRRVLYTEYLHIM